MSEAKQLQWMTPKEFLNFEQNAQEKHEYVNGFIIAMAGASRRHNLLTLAFASLLRSHLRGSPCQVFASDMKVNASHKGNNLFYYPDIMVSCNQENSNSYVEEHPQIIVEVLSPSTESRDRLEKLSAYTAIESLKEYVLVSQETMAVDLYQLTADGWVMIRHTNKQDKLVLNSIGYSMPLHELYEDVPDLTQ